MNECVQAALDELEAHGFKGRSEQRRKHVAILWQMNGVERTYYTASTPSDVRGHLNTRSDIRRLLREAAGDAQTSVVQFVPRIVAKGHDAVTNSRDVADAFDKRHDHVLRDIDNLLKNIDSPDLGNGLFRAVSLPDGQGVHRRSFDMTRDGFALLAMGFSGAKAIRFKLAFIEAFNAMESALRRSREDEIQAAALSKIMVLQGNLDALTDLVLEQPQDVPKQRQKKPQFIRPSVLRRMAAA